MIQIASKERWRRAPRLPRAPPTSLHTSSLKIIIRSIDPVLADRAEHIEHEGIIEGFNLVRDGRWNMQHLAFAHGDFLPSDQHLQGTLEHVGHLLALMSVHGHHGAAFEIYLGERFAITGHELARDHLGDLLQSNLVPAMKPDTWCGHLRRQR